MLCRYMPYIGAEQQEQENGWEGAYEGFPMPVVIFDVTTGTAKYANSLALQRLGISESDLETAPFPFALYAEELPHLVNGETVYLSLPHYFVNLAVLPSAPRYAVGCFCDYVLSPTMQATLDQRVLEIERLTSTISALEGYRVLAERLRIVHFELTSNGEIVYANRVAPELLGHQPDTLIQFNFLDVVLQEDRERARMDLERIAQGEQIGNTTYQLQRSDGQTVVVRVGGATTHDNGETIVHLDLINITEERDRAEQAFRLTLARSTLQLLDRFTTAISHEMRTPLSNIKLYLHLAGQENVTAERVNEYLRRSSAETDRLSTVIESLIRVSSILRELTDIRTNFRNRDDINAIVRASTRRFSRPGFTLSLEDIPSVSISERHIAIAIEELVENALDAVNGVNEDARQISVRTFVVDGQQGQELCISVADNGRGIPPQHLDRVFELFAQVDDSRHSQRMGVGLSIARDIARAHGGRITVQSEVGVGSTFTIHLPIRQ